MERRAFLATSLAASATAFAAVAGVAAAGSPFEAQAAEGGAVAVPAGGKQFYELRKYQLRRGPKQKLFDEYASKAAIPAMNRAGIGPIGVFHVMVGPQSPTAYVLIPYDSAEQFVGATDRMRADEEYKKLGAEFIEAPATDPAYIRVESSFMVAFDGIPRLEVPAAVKAGKSRIYELRTYESHSKRASKKKIEMFNKGEIALFRRTGLAPVFFGETLIGSNLPNLTYMLVFDSMADRDKNWGVFVSDPEWKKMSSEPGFTDPEIVSNISNLFLRPAAYSQI